jgi:hypothetical protein
MILNYMTQKKDPKVFLILLIECINLFYEHPSYQVVDNLQQNLF